MNNNALIEQMNKHWTKTMNSWKMPSSFLDKWLKDIDDTTENNWSDADIERSFQRVVMGYVGLKK